MSSSWCGYKFKQIFNVHLNHLLKKCITLIDDKSEIDNQVASELILKICSSHNAGPPWEARPPKPRFCLDFAKKNMAAGAAAAKNLPWQLCDLAIVESFDEN